MTFRALAGRAALAIGLLLPSYISPAVACEGAECVAIKSGKPLNIMQFMREQAASTRVSERPQKAAHAPAKTHRAPHRAIAARRKPVQMPPAAAASFASQPFLDAGEISTAAQNSADRTADSVDTETTGAAIGAGADVQLVDADEYNEIDRKTDDGPTSLTDPIDSGNAPNLGHAEISWLRWIWSSLENTFAALTTAVHQLIRL